MLAPDNEQLSRVEKPGIALTIKPVIIPQLADKMIPGLAASLG